MTESAAAFFDAFDATAEGCAFISHGPPKGCIKLKAAGSRLFVLVQGEPTGATLIAAFREGLNEGVLRPDMRVLVDLTQFTGIVDWSAVFQVRNMAPWGGGPDGASRIAYLVRNDLFGPLVKIASVLFYRSHHRAFDNRADAILWLEQP